MDHNYQQNYYVIVKSKLAILFASVIYILESKFIKRLCSWDGHSIHMSENASISLTKSFVNSTEFTKPLMDDETYKQIQSRGNSCY